MTKTIDIKYPTCWEEVRREHLMILGRLFCSKMTREELLFELLCRISGIHPLIEPGRNEDTPQAQFLFKKKGEGRFWMPAWMLAQACQQLSFIIDSIGLPECPILSVNSKLHGVSFKSFYFADAYICRYQTTKETAIILQAYKELTGRKIKKISPVEINALLIWWAGIKEYFKHTYPEVFRETGEEQTEKTPADTLVEVLSVLNKNEPGKNPQILASDVHAVMTALNNTYLIAKKHDNK